MATTLGSFESVSYSAAVRSATKPSIACEKAAINPSPVLRDATRAADADRNDTMNLPGMTSPSWAPSGASSPVTESDDEMRPSVRPICSSGSTILMPGCPASSAAPADVRDAT